MDSLRKNFSDAVESAFVAARTAVSGDKHRLQEDGFDLDLTYITPRIIAMAIPATSIEKVWRNHMDDVAEFLRKKHGENYLIFNLTENTYDTSKFKGKVKDCGWLDHHSPPLMLLYQVVQDMHSHLSASENNVVCIHCKAGRGRTGTAISSYLLHSGKFSDPDEAIRYFNTQRSKTGRGVEGPSQARSVHYFHAILTNRVPLSLIKTPKKLYLKRVIMYPVPKLGLRKCCVPIVEVWQNAQVSEELGATWTSSESRRYYASDDVVMALDVPNLQLDGDINIKVYDEEFFNRQILFHFYWHTSMITPDEYYFDLNARDLEGNLAANKAFSEDFKIRLLFERDPKTY